MARINETPEMTATRLRYAEAAKAWAEAVLARPDDGYAGDALSWPMRSAQIEHERACLKGFDASRTLASLLGDAAQWIPKEEP